ncbi:MAG: hypothetical protein EOO10_13000 [Chitinophagaceae bacterium]|nr:MAG: hypothetical protein EOO10_13000 [Chitinophagaceae bacterium]
MADSRLSDFFRVVTGCFMRRFCIKIGEFYLSIIQREVAGTRDFFREETKIFFRIKNFSSSAEFFEPLSTTDLKIQQANTEQSFTPFCELKDEHLTTELKAKNPAKAGLSIFN